MKWNRCTLLKSEVCSWKIVPEHPETLSFTFLKATDRIYLKKKQCLLIWSVHPSESVTIAAFWREQAGRKGECLFNECWMNVMLIWDLFPFSSIITLQIPISSVALHKDTSAARFQLGIEMSYREQGIGKKFNRYFWNLHHPCQTIISEVLPWENKTVH